ncbi:MAG: RHS repeat-associated core domain-containing protein, partial [Candidatus Nanopelagicales bacterium]|nr:RHS repeat-associated core domain-containing protein [Candidatus Nanopelagicales bacterium]
VSPHGDNANTLPLVDDQTSTRVGAGDGTIDGLDLDTWELYDAYGHPIDNTVGTGGVANTLQPTGSAASEDAPGGDRYGWLGDYQRPTSQATGLIQMGARPYNPNTGQFLSTDPIQGGNQNPYTYPVDPVNEFDISGLWTREQVAATAIACARIGNVRCAIATEITAALFVQMRQFNNIGEAGRHFVWNFMLMAEIGRWATKLWTRAHEAGDHSNDSRRDRRNNRLVQRTQEYNARNVGWYARANHDHLQGIAQQHFLQAWNGATTSRRSFSCVNKRTHQVKRCGPRSR